MLTNNFRNLNFHVANEKAQHALNMASFFFFLFFVLLALGKVLRGDFCCCPQYDPIKFFKSSSICSQ